MLNLTGQCMNAEAAIELLEMLPDNIPDEIKDDDFCDEYERMLNTFRYHVRFHVPIAPKVINPVSHHFMKTYTCGQCGYQVKTHEKYCPNCGRQINWKSIFPER